MAGDRERHRTRIVGSGVTRRATARRRRPRVLPWVLLFIVLTAIVIGALYAPIDAPPRSLGRYLQHRVDGHSAIVADLGDWFAEALTAADRGEARNAALPRLRIGAQPVPPAAEPAGARLVPVASADEAIAAIQRARPGDAITFAPGTYRFDGQNIAVTQPGTAAAPIVVRARSPGSVVLDMQISEGFVVSAPYWRFESLTIKGRCADDSDCEHAFHVVGGAKHFVARNNALIDFNAHIKINGQDQRYPDDGTVENNTITNSHARQTDRPVTPIDLVAASNWTIRSNTITDFIKAGGDQVSYGAFAKGGGSDNRFERNVVVCEDLLRGHSGARVGLSLGGGGSTGPLCRGGACNPEQQGGRIESNLIASCSDDGIYVNRGAVSRVADNTLIDTGGIVARFVETGAEVEGNLVDGAIRSRDGALVHASKNLQTNLASLYVGHHPQRALFRDALAWDLTWRAEPPRRAPSAATSRDLCGSDRPVRPTYGAFEDFGDCIVASPRSP